MIAEFDGQDYLIVLNREDSELSKLHEGERLEVLLTHKTDGKERKVFLQFGENNHSDGIDLKYSPEEREGWADIKEISITINQFAYEHISLRGNFGTRYNGSDKIDIYNGRLRSL